MKCYYPKKKQIRIRNHCNAVNENLKNFVLGILVWGSYAEMQHQ